MLVSYKWLQEYFEDNLPAPEKLVDILSLQAFEIEGLEKIETVKGEDFVIDVDVLPNRSHDCLSHDGIAKEVAVLTGLSLKDKNILEKESDFESNFQIKTAAENCRRYIACEVKNINITESPNDLKAKMQSLGQKSINNLVDITNIVMFEIGQPMHAFDTDKLQGQEINIRGARNEEKITTLDNKEVNLDEEILVISDQTNALAIAGIKGGKKAEVNPETKNIILESANFNPTNVRKTARKIGINTDSSKRFENEVSPELAILAMNRATELIMQYAATEKTTVSNKVDYYPKQWRNYQTGVSAAEINSLLGLELSEKEIANTFDKLGFKYEIVNPREKIVEEAQSLLDRPYKYGASVFFDAPKAFDCSSLVSYVYSIAGYSIPRMAIDQFVFSQKIDESQLLPGDLIFVNTEILDRKIDYKSVEFLPGTEVTHGVDHVGIYIGDGKVIHATEWNESGVIEEILSQSERFKNIVGYRRVIKSDESGSENRFAVEVPTERLDIKNGPDLIEEIGRVVGYSQVADESVAEKIPEKDFTPNINQSYQLSLLLRNTLADLGFSEIITYSFIEEGTLEPVKPIAEDKSFVRGSLLPGMTVAFDKNINNADLLGLDHIKLFEIGKVFAKIKKQLNDEAETEKSQSGEQETREQQTKFPESDFIIEENLMLSIGVRNKQGVKKPNAETLLTEAVEKINEKLGIDLMTDYGVKINQQTESLEINLDKILASGKIKFEQYTALPEISDDVKYKPFSAYPFMLRDIAVWVPAEIENNEIIEVIKGIAGELLTNHKLFDVYEKNGRTSYANRLVFQSDEKTLTDEEANKIMDKINQQFQDRGWEVR